MHYLTRLASLNIWVKFRSRNSEVFKIYTKYLSFLVYNQVYNLFVCTLCPCLTSFLKWNWDKPLRNSRWLDVTRVSWKSRLRLDCVRKHDIERLFIICVKKKAISNLHVIRMPLNEQSQFFSHTVSPSQTSRIPDETKKILGPKITPPPEQISKP